MSTPEGRGRLASTFLRGAWPGGGAPPYYFIAEMYFDDENGLRAALRSPEGRAAGDDVQRFASGLVSLLYVQVA